MKENLDRVNMWIGNCDQKASFLLAFIGVAATVVCTSDFFAKIKDVLVLPFKAYCNQGEGSFDILRLLIFICLIVGLCSVLVALIKLIMCLKANIDPKKFYKAGMTQKSFLFFKTISEMDYDEFKEGSSDIDNDLCTQVYTNSAICTKKFRLYNQAIVWVFAAIPAFLFSVILMLFV